MSDTIGFSNIENSDSELYNILKNCANLQSCESLSDYSDVYSVTSLYDYGKMMANSQYSTSGNISTSSFASDDSCGDNILEEDGRISLAYENLRTIPRRIAEKFANQTKFLDLSYNNFQNLSFLSFFEDLHTLILDRNSRLEVNTLPYLPNLKILWINNCDISNVTDWIQRIQHQCPTLEQLSIMGNPGTQQRFSYCAFTSPTKLAEPSVPTTLTTDYREYVLNMLPSLEYLDGVARYAYSAPPLANNSALLCNGRSASGSASASSFSSISNGSGTPSGNCTGSSANNSHNDNGNVSDRKISIALSFKDLFRLNRRRKKSYQSSSTN